MTRPAIPQYLLKQLATALCLLLACCLAGPGARAQKLRIVTIESAPFGFFDETGKPAGMMYEIGNLIAQEAGFAYTNKIVPYPRTVALIASGEADLALRYSNPELRAAAIQVAQVLSLQTIVVGRAGVQLGSLQDLHGKYVGIPRGGRFDEGFDADHAIHKYPVADYPQMLRMLMAGRLDAGIGSSVGIYYNAHVAGIGKDKLGKPLLLSARQFELHFSKKTASADAVAALQQAVQRLQKRGAINEIIEKYYRTFDAGTKGKQKPAT